MALAYILLTMGSSYYSVYKKWSNAGSWVLELQCYNFFLFSFFTIFLGSHTSFEVETIATQFGRFFFFSNSLLECCLYFSFQWNKMWMLIQNWFDPILLRHEPNRKLWMCQSKVPISFGTIFYKMIFCFLLLLGNLTWIFSPILRKKLHQNQLD